MKKEGAVYSCNRSKRRRATCTCVFGEMHISDKESGGEDCMCPKCGLIYRADRGVWICCDGVTIRMT